MAWSDKIGGKDRSLIGTAATAGKAVVLPASAVVAKAARKAAGVDRFSVGGRDLSYVVHPYNETWRNERAVELAIAFDWLDRRPPGPVLEIGHVTAHYRSTPQHTIVDLYEPAEGVLNVDALTYAPPERFTSILAISTLEHVGFDEDDQDPDKTRRLVDHLASLLAPTGELLVTFPLGYNRYLDDHLAAGAFGFSDVTLLRRITTLGAWEEAPLEDLPKARYGFPFRNGNMIAVGRRGPAGG
jgi:hypothetical protein